MLVVPASSAVRAVNAQQYGEFPGAETLHPRPKVSPQFNDIQFIWASEILQPLHSPDLICFGSPSLKVAERIPGSIPLFVEACDFFVVLVPVARCRRDVTQEAQVKWPAWNTYTYIVDPRSVYMSTSNSSSPFPTIFICLELLLADSIWLESTSPRSPDMAQSNGSDLGGNPHRDHVAWWLYREFADVHSGITGNMCRILQRWT